MSKVRITWRTKDTNVLFVVIVMAMQLITSSVGYETYYMDHQVTEREARNAVGEAYNRTQKSQPNWCGAMCTEEVMTYCLSVHLIQDHCCCNQGHEKEDLGWVPHSCYMGKEICKPVAKSCIDYMHRRQCCCDRLLAEMLHHEYSSAIRASSYVSSMTLSIVMLIVLLLSMESQLWWRI